jgi:hypothetical protein
VRDGAEVLHPVANFPLLLTFRRDIHYRSRNLQNPADSLNYRLDQG